jgi:hypothetical protein
MAVPEQSLHETPEGTANRGLVVLGDENVIGENEMEDLRLRIAPVS